MIPWIATFFGGISLRTKVIGTLAILIAFAAFMALRAHDRGVRDEVHSDYEKASTEAVLDAVTGEREANANSDVRQDEFEAQQAQNRKDVDDAKANGGDAVSAYLRSVCESQGNCPKDKPAK